MFCRNCGEKLSEGAQYCKKCGTKVILGEETIGASPSHYGENASHPELTGFSSVYCDPQIQAFEEKQRRSAGGCLLSLAGIVPIIVAAVSLGGLAAGENDLEAVFLLTGLSLVPAAVLVILALLRKAAARREKPMWEGVVVGKSRKKERDRHADKHDSSNNPHYYTLYTIHIRTDDGEKKKFSFSDDPALYGYYREGDRVRCHPVLNYYEKYDKSHDNCIFCACCKARNPIQNTVCNQCGMPLFK